MHVEFFGLPRERAGIPAVEVQAETLGQLLEKLAVQIPPLAEFVDANRLHPVFVANLNGDWFVNDPATPLCESDHVLILSADAGGQLAMAFGYHGRYLRIDVSCRSAEYLPLQDQVLRQFLGGSGLGVWLLLHEGAAQVNPLAPEAPIVFAFSPLVGSPLTTSAKFAVVSKSPLTGRINDSLASSGFAIAGKRCGCDAIVIVGRVPELSLVIIDEKNNGDPAPVACHSLAGLLLQRWTEINSLGRLYFGSPEVF